MAKKDETKNDETGTDLAVSPELAQELAQFANDDAALERPALSTISLRSGVMQYLDTPVDGNEMDVVVVGWSFERSYYSTAFDADNIVPPDCFALSLTGKDMGPDKDYGFGTVCETCEHNQWGTARGGKGKGKACGERRRLVVAPADIVKQGTLEGAELAMLKVPVTSIKNWGTYINKLRSGLARPAWAVVTNIKVVPDAKTQFKVLFDLVEPINDAGLIQQLRAANADSSIYTMQPFDMSGSQEPGEEPAESDKF